MHGVGLENQILNSTHLSIDTEGIHACLFRFWTPVQGLERELLNGTEHG